MFGVQLLVVAYYGLLSVGESIENPFAWDTFGEFVCVCVCVYVCFIGGPRSRSLRIAFTLHTYSFPTHTHTHIHPHPPTDIDFERFAQQLSRDTSAISETLKDDRASFLKELVHPHEEE